MSLVDLLPETVDMSSGPAGPGFEVPSLASTIIAIVWVLGLTVTVTLGAYFFFGAIRPNWSRKARIAAAAAIPALLMLLMIPMVAGGAYVVFDVFLLSVITAVFIAIPVGILVLIVRAVSGRIRSP